MIISDSGLSVSYQVAQLYAESGGQEIAAPAAETFPEPSPDETIPETEPTADQKVRGENGVLRLLQEGHFKPHAEMRLMEIFHRDLAILQAQNADGAPPEEPSSNKAETA